MLDSFSKTRLGPLIGSYEEGLLVDEQFDKLDLDLEFDDLVSDTFGLKHEQEHELETPKDDLYNLIDKQSRFVDSAAEHMQTISMMLMEKERTIAKLEGYLQRCGVPLPTAFGSIEDDLFGDSGSSIGTYESTSSVASIGSEENVAWLPPPPPISLRLGAVRSTSSSPFDLRELYANTSPQPPAFQPSQSKKKRRNSKKNSRKKRSKGIPITNAKSPWAPFLRCDSQGRIPVTALIEPY